MDFLSRPSHAVWRRSRLHALHKILMESVKFVGWAKARNAPSPRVHEDALGFSRGHASLCPPYKTPSPTLTFGRRNARFVEAALDHRIDLAHQDVGRELVLGAARS